MAGHQQHDRLAVVPLGALGQGQQHIRESEAREYAGVDQ